jgi:hypothetical protein
MQIPEYSPQFTGRRMGYGSVGGDISIPVALMVRRAEWAMSSSSFLPVDDLLRAGFIKGKKRKKVPLGN